jgi:BMFP domain-containing protein YqiC
MTDRPRILDDIAGVAGGALSALSGLRDEAEAMGRARAEDMIRKMGLVRREEFEVAAELAARARAGQEAAEARMAALEARIAALEARLAADEFTLHAEQNPDQDN